MPKKHIALGGENMKINSSYNVSVASKNVANFTKAALFSTVLFYGTANAYTISTFNPSDFFAVGVSPTAGQTSDLNVAAGIGSSFAIEDFEDNALISGLTIGVNGGSPTSTIPAAPGVIGPGRILQAGSAWNGDRVLGTLLRENEPTDFNIFGGADFFGIGISGFHIDNNLFINGQSIGAINSTNFTEFLSNPSANERNIYLLIAREAGDSQISNVSFANNHSTGDFVRFDHIAIASTVPVPSAVWLFVSGLLGLIGFSRRKSA